ncbi:dienelactone hydrolase family protein [Acidimicrobium ferrooxidans]|nr:dienelactone hydrolase family protein [Acidimicrobium ferrooxidans]
MTLSTVTDYPVASTTVRYNRGSRMIYAYQSRPRDWGHYPGLLVLHGVGGLTDDYRNITRKLAANDYVGKAPDLYSRAESPKPKHLETLEAQQDWFAKLEDSRVFDDLACSWKVMARLHWTFKKPLAVMGFGMGAYYAMLYAGMNPEVRACIAVGPQFLFDQPALTRKEIKAGKIDLKPHKFDAGLLNMKADLITVFPGQDPAMPAAKAQEFLDMVDRQSFTSTSIPYEGANAEFWLESADSYQAEYADDMWNALFKYFKRRLR